MQFQLKAGGKILTKGALKTYPAPKRPAAANLPVKVNGVGPVPMPCKLTAGKGRGSQTAFYGYVSLEGVSYYFPVPAGFEPAKAVLEVSSAPVESPAPVETAKAPSAKS